mgnify:CR=1 FL=1
MKDKVTGADILPVTVFDAVKDSKGHFFVRSVTVNAGKAFASCG